MKKNRVLIGKQQPVTKKSRAIATAAPDICLTPSPTGPIPLPYVNIAHSKNLKQGSTRVRIQGASVMLADSCISPSTGNEAGSLGGILSKKTRGATKALTTSVTVKIEGQGVVRDRALTIQNSGNALGIIRHH